MASIRKTLKENANNIHHVLKYMRKEDNPVNFGGYDYTTVGEAQQTAAH